MGKAQYKTKQMSEMFSFLKATKGRHVTVNDICDYFKKKGINVGITTIYRHLERMVNEGIVAKYVVDKASGACFEYIGERDVDEVGEDASGYHCKCEKCGKLIHLHCDEVAELKRHISDNHDFEIDLRRSVFYGICGECRKK